MANSARKRFRPTKPLPLVQQAAQLRSKLMSFDILMKAQYQRPNGPAPDGPALSRSRTALESLSRSFPNEPLPHLHILTNCIHENSRENLTFRLERMAASLRSLELIQAAPDNPCAIPLGHEPAHAQRLDHVKNWCAKEGQPELVTRLQKLIDGLPTAERPAALPAADRSPKQPTLI